MYKRQDIDTQTWDGENWVTTVTDNPDSESVTVRFDAPEGEADDEFSVKVFVWNGFDADVEWFYRCEKVEPAAPPRNPMFTVDPPAEGYAGDEADCIGGDFEPGVEVILRWDSSDGPEIGQVVPDSDGNFNVSVTIPLDLSLIHI